MSLGSMKQSIPYPIIRVSTKVLVQLLGDVAAWLEQFRLMREVPDRYRT